LSALLVVAATTCFNLILSNWSGYYVLSLVYLLVVVVLGLFVGRGPNLLAAALSALLGNFLFVPPLYTFVIANARDALMFVALLVVALAMGQLTTRLRAQQGAEREREERATALYLLTRELAEAKDLAQLLGTVVRQLGTTFHAEVALLYVTKPFSTGELLARLRVAQRHAQPTPDTAVFRSGHLEVDLTARVVTVKGKEVKLTATEYSLLRLFVQHSGKVLTHRQILREVWGANYVEQTHYLRVYVAHLREKLEANPAQPELFITEPGVGYRLVG